MCLNCSNHFRVMIIDLDAHQGNGHEKDFANDGMTFTFSAHYLFNI
jgi:histone deacetylase 11